MTVQETAADIGQYVTEQLTQREVAARAWERQSNEWEARWRAVTDDRDAWERRYRSAVDGRAKFREAFRKARDKERSARKWVDEFGWALMDELEHYQNNDPDRAPYVNRISQLEAELAAARTLIADLESRLREAQQAVWVAEEKNSS